MSSVPSGWVRNWRPARWAREASLGVLRLRGVPCRSDVLKSSGHPRRCCESLARSGLDRKSSSSEPGGLGKNGRHDVRKENDSVFKLTHYRAAAMKQQNRNGSLTGPLKLGRYWCQMRDIRPHVVELVLEQDSHRLTIAQTGTCVNDLEPEHYRWAGPLEPPR